MGLPGVKETVETILKWVDDHLSLRYFAMFFVLALAFLFAINPALHLLGLPLIPPVYRVIAVALVIVMGAGTLFCSIENGGKWLSSQCDKRRRATIYKDLPDDELDILAQFLDEGKRTLFFLEGQQPLLSLVHKGILEQAEKADMGMGLTAYRDVYSLTPESNARIREPEFQSLLQARVKKTQ